MIYEENGRAKVVRTIEEEIKAMQRDWASLSAAEQKYIIRLLSGDEQINKEAARLRKSHYRRPPVSIEEFIEDEYYSGPSSRNLYPKLKEDIIEVINGNYFEVILTGSIGYGKSFFSITGMLYSLYKLTCLADPQETYGLAAGTPIYFALMSTTQVQASRSIYQDLMNRVQSSPYFQELSPRPDFGKYEAKITDSIRIVCAASTSEGLIGLNVFGAIMDEVNFGANNKQFKQDKTLNSKPVTRIEKVHQSITKRIKSRFMRHGSVPGVLFVISSKNTDLDFTAKRIQDGKDDPGMYVMDYAEWDVKPQDKYSGEKFRVFFGGRTLPSRILAEGEAPPNTDDEMAEVLVIPIEYRGEFENDIETAIRDIAGKAVPRVMPYLNKPDAIKWMSDDRQDGPHPLPSLSWESGSTLRINWNLMVRSYNTKTLGGLIEVKHKPILNPDAPRHIHIDPSLTTDATGFCMGHVAKWVEVTVRDPETGVEYREQRPFIKIDLLLQIVAPPNDEIRFSNIRHLIYELRKHGYTITLVTSDTYQSADTLQVLEDNGFTTERFSLDTKPDGYDTLKEAMYERRVSVVKNEILERELSLLKKDNLTGKVDHIPGESKDLSDSLAGVVYTLSRNSSRGVGLPSDPFEREGRIEHPLDTWHDLIG
jgi:hypothetical protein